MFGGIVRMEPGVSIARSRIDSKVECPEVIELKALKTKPHRVL